MGNKIVTMDDAIKSKKASWLSNYVSYLSFEDKFIPSKNVAYKWGDVVKVNLGFNVGSELGGAHYAIVLDKENKHTSNTLTIIPLSSYKGKVYERDIFLQDDLFKQINRKWKTLLKTANDSYDKLMTLINLIVSTSDSNSFPEVAITDESGNNVANNDYNNIINEFISQKNELEEKLRQLENMKHEIDMMKTGSIAKIEQITTVSKMRIFDPQKTGDVLYGVRLSPESMDAINEKLKELYLF